MFPIKNKQLLSADVKRLDILAPDIARKIQPGQFVSVCPEEGDERIPLTVIDSSSEKGTITLIFKEVGYTTQKLGAFAINEEIFSILGPLGMPAQAKKVGTAICIATGVGTAQMLPVARALKKAGNKVIGIIGAKNKRSLLLESQLRILCEKIFITTNDGSYQFRGLATDILKDFVNKQIAAKVDVSTMSVVAIGSADMMEAVCEFTRLKNIPTRVHLNPMMVDCMGMCGSCRVKVKGEIVLGCIDGPEFDGHQVDFEDFKIRLKAFEEIDEWRSHQLKPSPKKSEDKTFTKFLAGILKK